MPNAYLVLVSLGVVGSKLGRLVGFVRVFRVSSFCFRSLADNGVSLSISVFSNGVRRLLRGIYVATPSQGAGSKDHGPASL